MWHVQLMRCPACKVPAKVDEVAFNEEQMVRFEATCPKCKHRLFLEEHISESLPKPEKAAFDLAAWRPEGRGH